VILTGLFSAIKQRIQDRSPTAIRFQMMTDRGNGFYAWDGKLFHSDIIRACIRPKVKAVGKLVGKHIRETVTAQGKNLTVNPDAYIRFLLEEPNPFMTGQVMQEKLETQLCLNNNAFAVIVRDDRGYPVEIYPVPAAQVDAIYDAGMNLYLKFYFPNGRQATFPYSDVIHLRHDVYENDIFGESPAPALSGLMDVVNTTDQGIIRAIKNSSIIQWLLKFTNSLRPEDLQKQATDFANNYLSINSASVGVAAVDSKAEAVRVEPKDYVPNAAQMDRTTKRIYSFFNTNEKIVQSAYDENQWQAYAESEIEPDQIQLSNEFTRKIFTRREREYGNHIHFEAANLQYASMQTKLGLQAMVDRGAMSANEWRSVLNLAPVPGGDVIVRRLDTQPINGNDGDGGDED
jgi:HK97 family phage portal protein